MLWRRGWTCCGRGWWDEMDGTEICAAEPPFASGGFGKGSGGGESGKRCWSENELCNVGGFIDGDGVVGFVLENDADFSTIVIVNDASSDVDMTEGKTAARLDGASDCGWNGESEASWDLGGAVRW